MSARSEESAVERLRKQAERALAGAQGRRVIEPLLERIVSLAPDGSDASVFAHRHLAEYRIEDHPWRALLHLRKVVIASPDDDVVHALTGLSHALLANFRAAVSAYRRALALAPRNPWYHHNLGHLLDVALDQPRAALRHLELAHRAADPPEHEIAASLAHCLARLGRLDEARETASAAVRAEPRNREHKQLLAWIERGAPEESGDPRTRRARGAETQTVRPPAASARQPRRSGSRADPPASVQDSASPRPAAVPDPAPAVASPASRPAGSRRSAAGAASRDAAVARDGVVARDAAGSERGHGRLAAGHDAPPRRRAPSRAGSLSGTSERDAAPDGASASDASFRSNAGAADDAVPAAPSSDAPSSDAVSALVERVMRDGGFTPEHVARARRLWVDYRQSAPRSSKPDVCAAAIEYAIARLHGLDGVTRASVARRYGVSARAVSERFDDIQVVLALKPGDPRYARC